MKPDATVVDSLSAFTFLVDATLGLKTELPTYLAKVAILAQLSLPWSGGK